MYKAIKTYGRCFLYESIRNDASMRLAEKSEFEDKCKTNPSNAPLMASPSPTLLAWSGKLFLTCRSCKER